MKKEELTGRYQSPVLEKVFFSCYFAFVGIFVYFILFCQWIKKTISLIPKAVSDFFSVKLETIDGDLVDLEERDEPFFYFPFQFYTYDNTMIPILDYQIVPVHRYILTLKKGVELVTIRVPLVLYRKLERQIKKGTKHISLICEKNQLENVYDFYDKKHQLI
jgi:hypothetical protein